MKASLTSLGGSLVPTVFHRIPEFIFSVKMSSWTKTENCRDTRQKWLLFVFLRFCGIATYYSWRHINDCGPKIFETPWQQMATNGNKWQQMATNGNKWRQMATDGDKWRQMATDGDKWRQMATDGDKCHRVSNILGATVIYLTSYIHRNATKSQKNKKGQKDKKGSFCRVSQYSTYYSLIRSGVCLCRRPLFHPCHCQLPRV